MTRRGALPPIAVGGGLDGPLRSLPQNGIARAKPALGRVYLAGPLFSDAERAFNLALSDRIEHLGWRVWLPQRDLAAARGRGRTRRLFEGCVRGLRAADLVVAVCDGATADDGTAWECGYAVALGTPVYALRTDVRRVAADERVNLMIQESAADVFTSVERLLQALRRRTKGARSRDLTRR